MDELFRVGQHVFEKMPATGCPEGNHAVAA